MNIKYLKKYNFVDEFNCLKNSLELSINRMINWINKGDKKISESLKIKDINLFGNYLKLFIISRKIEYGYQYLMSKWLIDVTCEIVADGVKIRRDMTIPKRVNYLENVKQFKRILFSILFNINHGIYVIERNTNFETMNLLTNSK